MPIEPAANRSAKGGAVCCGACLDGDLFVAHGFEEGKEDWHLLRRGCVHLEASVVSQICDRSLPVESAERLDETRCDGHRSRIHGVHGRRRVRRVLVSPPGRFAMISTTAARPMAAAMANAPTFRFRAVRTCRFC